MQSITGTLLILGVLLFIVFRILQTLNGQNQRESGGSKTSAGGGGKVFRMPERRVPDIPQKITLVSFDGKDEKNPFDGDATADESLKAVTDRGGCELVGLFEVKEMPGYHLQAFTHAETSLVGIIYHDPSGRVWLNLLTEYKDGRVITTSSAEDIVAKASVRPKGMPLFNYPFLPAEQLLRRHKLETRETEKADPVKKEGFAEFFEANYVKLRKGVDASIPYIGTDRRGENPLSFPPPLPDETTAPEVKEERANIQSDSFVPNRETVAGWLREVYSSVEVAKEKRDKFQRGLVWVLESAGMESVSMTMSEYADVTFDEVEKGRWVVRSSVGAEDIIEPGELKGSALFDKINSSLPAENKFFKIPAKIDEVAFYSSESF